MTRYVTLQDARQSLTDLIAATQGGAEFVITEYGKAAARLMPLNAHPQSEPKGIKRETIPPQFEAADVRVSDMQDNATAVPHRMRELPRR
jgi:antitoxin (DNA-binding transcriptional repressor) of toxin-antitoxin stability system